MSKEKKTKSKREQAEQMLAYTYRDSGQEMLMRQKMLRAIVFAIVVTIALVVFIALYVGERHRIQETYRLKYQRAMIDVAADVESYRNADGDFELRYRILLADLACANSYAFLLEDFTEHQKSVNGFYTVVLKYPKQTSEKMDEIAAFMVNINQNLDKGYDEMDEFIDSINLKGF